MGRRLRVSFGNRELVGVVEGIGDGNDSATLKAALEWRDAAPLLAGELYASLRWLARYTHAPLGEVVATALPAPLRRGEPLPDTHGWAWELTGAGRDGLFNQITQLQGACKSAMHWRSRASNAALPPSKSSCSCALILLID